MNFQWTNHNRHIRTSRIIAVLLILLIIIAIIVHNNLASLNGEGGLQQSHRSRSKLELRSEDERLFTAPNLDDEIRKLSKVKASVNNELRDMESRRHQLQSQMSRYQMEIDGMRSTQDNLEKEIKLLRLSLDQLSLQKEELDGKYLPILRAPQRILMGDNSNDNLSNTSSSRSCQMYSCFDYSRCSILSGFNVYFYDPFQYTLHAPFVKFIKMSVISSLAINPYITKDPSKACLFVVLVGQLESSEENSKSLENFLKTLPHWHGDGRNHVIINLMQDYNGRDMFGNVDTGRAMLVQSPFIESKFRHKFDIIVPPSMGKAEGDVWEELPMISPIRRTYFLSFWGQFRGVISQNSAKIEGLDDKNGGKSKEILESSILSQVESVVVSALKDIQSVDENEFFVKFSCDSVGPGAINGEWSICGTDLQRKDLLIKSTFSLILAPANTSYVSSTVFQLRLYESLKHGAVPVILGDYVELPFSDVLDWTKAVIILPKARASEFYFILRTYTDNSIAELRQMGRYYFETYFGTSRSIINTVLAILRTRLSMPARPIQDVPSPNVFNSTNMQPLAEGTEINSETDEVLGPLELPFSSMKFKQNFTQHVSYESFSKVGYPFELFPYTPFEKALPSDAKYAGSGFGFRPIGRGWGGAGKEFSEALGGNFPREQFTIVMPTYERDDVLISALQRLKGLPFLNKVIVVWNNPAPPSPIIKWPEIGVPIKVLKMPKNSLNNHFLPFDAIETEAVLSIDDDAHLRHDEIVFGFRVWREERDRIVGFPGRFHAWDVKTNSWYYNSNYTCELSMVLTGAAFFHKYYSYLYTHVMPQAIRDKVDEYINCEDIAMNFLVSHITRKSPLKVTSRWTFRCPGCPQTLASDNSHFEERHKCVNFFMRVYGYMPLLYTQYRVDSVLFKTRLPHDKQKCFKYI
ncbi:hypothetical protein FSP39_018243 [Pinctada imbricata]|uniref:glucuronosyl-galactosyl-proteoglycan 4-alpha-N-acetylglucosaminyltransferase n=1 Tax=Pinctada imbricata TaxID=66713 RepID=A0AA89BZF8_PINIB|nr:hypothetical protein FSP39_018243 [Pinctada imbricata]